MKKAEKKKIQTTKILIFLIIISSICFLEQSYILAFLGKEQIAEELSKIIASTICFVMAEYCCKSYFETKKSEEMKYIKEKTETEMDFNDNGNIY